MSDSGGVRHGQLLPADERDELLALLSHELRTPLAPLGGFVETVLDHHADQLGPDAERLLRVAARNASRLQSAIDRVLLTIRAVTGSAVVLEDVPVRGVVDDVLAEVGSSTDVRVQVPGDLVVRTGREQLRLLLVELLENAVVHGAEPVEVTATRVGDGVEVRVADHGPGIDPDFARRMFEGFTQQGATLQRTQGGLGLGLRMAAGLARLVGAELVHDDERDGATFVVQLPSGRAAEPHSPERAEELAAVAQEDVTPLRIRRAVEEAHHRMLLVSSREDVRVTLADLTRSLGARFTGVADAGDNTIVVDLAVGAGPPLFAAATGEVRRTLERQLPDLIEKGLAVLARQEATHYDASQVVDLLAVHAVQPIRRDLELRYARGQSVEQIVDEVLRPALREIGDRWETGVWSVADQQAATELLETLVSGLELRLRTAVHHGARVTIVGVPGDGHPLPSRLLALELLERDVDVRWIGGSTPPGAVARDLEAHRPDVLLLCCSFGPLLGGAVDVARVAASHDIPVVIGGNAVLRHPDLAAATGCIVAPDGLDELEDLVTAALPPADGADLDGSWADHVAGVRRELGAHLDGSQVLTLTADEVHWLAEAVALAQWQTDHGGGVLKEFLDVLDHALTERGESSAAVLPAVRAAAEEVAVGA